MAVAIDYQLSANEYLVDAARVLMRVIKGGRVDNLFGREHHHIGYGAGADHASISQAEMLCRGTGHLVDGRFQIEKLLLAAIHA